MLADAARDFLEGAVEQDRVAGAVALISYGDELAFFGAAGMADREAGIPMTTDTLFRIASMTKPVTSVAVMMLVERGELALNDPVSDFIPEFSSVRVLAGDGNGGSVPAETAITIHHLLTHTSGIGYRFYIGEPLASAYRTLEVSDGLWPREDEIRDAMTRLASAPLAHQPGAAWTYGLSTDVLGAVIEIVSGDPLDLFFRENIFEPLGMTDTFFYVPEEKQRRLAAVYHWDGDDLSRISDEPVVDGDLEYWTRASVDGPTTYFSGGGGLTASTSDYFRFARMLAKGGALDGVRLLETESVEAMTRNQIGELEIDGGGKFGLGFLVAGRAPGQGTFGWGGFYHTRFWVDRDHDLVAIFMAQLLPEDAAVHDAFTAAIESVLGES